MKKHHWILLSIAVALTATCFVHDYLYDTTSKPYSIRLIIADVVLGGTMYTVLFYLVLFAFYSWYRSPRIGERRTRQTDKDLITGDKNP